MSYNDLKVIEAKLFLQSIVDGTDANPVGERGAGDGAGTSRRCNASFESRTWEAVQPAGIFATSSNVDSQPT